MTERTAVLALGNPLLSDEGVGAAALARLRDRPGVEAVDGGTDGLTLLAWLRGIRRLLVLDAVETGLAAGTVVRLEPDALPGGDGVHRLGLPDLLAALELLGEPPTQVVVLGVQPGRLEPGLDLSPEVARAVPALVEHAEAVLDGWLG